MAVGHAFSVLCYIIQLFFVLNKILYSMDENIATEDEKLLYYKIKDSLSTINVDRNGSLWCFGKDKALRNKIDRGAKNAFYLRFGRVPTSCLNRSLLLIAGDIATNPGPSRNLGVGQYRDSNTDKNKLSILYPTREVYIVNKVDLLQLEISNHQSDIVILTETHLSSSISDTEIFSSNFTVFRQDRNRHGGDVLIAAVSPCKIVHRDDINTDAEILVVEIMLKHNQKITLMVFYRPPNNELHSLEELQRVIDEISTPEYIIVGD